ncbi:MAG: hypothetical protein PUC50_07420, partial [Bacteroidales bacterium]|nr:hypothetical protein [Bacteroidales bacterium]
MKTTIHTTMKTIMKLAAVMLILCISSGVYAQKVYYSWKTGNWNETSIWSSNSETYQAVDQIPSAADEVYIVEPVNIVEAGAVAKILHVNATLTVVSGGYPTVESLKGYGNIVLKGDFYPEVTSDDNFTGMAVFDGTTPFTITRNIAHYADISLNLQKGKVTFNIPPSPDPQPVGTLRVTAGEAVIENHIEIEKDLVINQGCTLTVNADKKLITLGNTVNTGTLTCNGEFVFASETANQTLSLKGATSFNKITVNKGTPDYTATIMANATGLMTLSPNAINIIDGNLAIGSNIDVVALTGGQNDNTTFTIPANGALTVAGGNVTTMRNIIVEGELQIKSGNFKIGSNNEPAGVVLNGGAFNVAGGESEVKYITDNNVASAFRMTAGELTLTDNDQNNNVSFTLTNPNTVYTLSGGTFIFKGQQFENHSANAIATGGKFIFDSDKNPVIAYTAPFYSLHIKQGMVKYSPAQDDFTPLKVNGDFIVETGVQFYNSGRDLYIGGNLTLESGVSNFAEIKDLYFITDKNSTINTNGKDLSFNNLYVDKQNSKSLILTSDITVPNTLTVSRGNIINDNNQHKITVKGSVVNNGSITPDLYLSEGGNLTIAGSGVYNSVYQNKGVSLASDVTVNNYHFVNGFCSLNSYVITINNSLDGNNTTNKYFINNTNKVSSGLRMHVFAEESHATGNLIEYPIGFDNNYTPAIIQIRSALDATLDEWVTFNVVQPTSGHHPCLKSNNNINTYWVAKSTSNNTTNKGKINYHFTASQTIQGNNTYHNLALIGTGWIDGGLVSDNTSVNFSNNAYSLPSGDFTAGKKSDDNTKINVLYSSKTPSSDSYGVRTVSNTQGIYGGWEKGWYLADGTQKDPKEGDILIINGFDMVEFDRDFRLGKVIFANQNDPTKYGRFQITSSGKSVGEISTDGGGILELQSSFTNEFILNSDYSQFDQDDNAQWLLNVNRATTIQFDHQGAYSNLAFTGGSYDVSFSEDVEVRNVLNIRMIKFLVKTNVTCGILKLGGNQQGRVEFQSGNSKIFEIGKLDFDHEETATGSGKVGDRYFSLSGGALQSNHNTLRILGDIVYNNTTLIKSSGSNQKPKVGFELVNGSDYVSLEFAGNENSKIEIAESNRNSFVFNVAQIVVDKEEGKSVTFKDKEITFLGNLAGANTSEGKALVLKNGEAIFDFAGQEVPLSSGGDADFVIPSTAKLTAKASGVKFVVDGCGAGVTLGGELTLNSGTEFSNPNGHLYYQETGHAKLTVEDGAKFTAAQFCPDPLSSGKITLTVKTTFQNGWFKIGGGACVSTTKHGIFDITDGSKFKLPGSAEIHFLDGIATNAVPDVAINAAASDCEFGDNSKLVFDASEKTVYKDFILSQNTYTVVSERTGTTRGYYDWQNKWKDISTDFDSDLKIISSEIPEELENVVDSYYASSSVSSITDNSIPKKDGGTYYYVFDTYTKKVTQTIITTYTRKPYYDANTVIKIPDGTTNVSSYTLASNTPLPNVVINNNATVTLKNVALTVAKDLDVTTGGKLVAGDINMNLKGHFKVDGTYTADNNTVDFCGNVAQNVSGSSNIPFYNVTVTNKTKPVTFAYEDSDPNSVIIKNNLVINEGATLTDSGKATTVEVLYKNDHGSYLGNGGIMLSNSNNHTIEVISNGHNSKLDINNTAGVEVLNTNGDSLVIDKALVITNGILNMKTTTLVLGEEVNTVENGNPSVVFGRDKQIIFETSNNGVRKIFSGNESQVHIPMGVSGKYTPATINVSAITPKSVLTIKPVNAYHSTILNYKKGYPQWLEDGPMNNALSFYWRVFAEGVENFVGNLTFKDDYDDYHAVNKNNPNYPDFPSHYVAARLLSNKTKWDKLPILDDDPSFDQGVIIFDSNNGYFDMKNDATISGDYTAGLIDNDGNGALPGKIPVYVSVQDGPWSSGETWLFAETDENGTIQLDDYGDVKTTNKFTQTIKVDGEDVTQTFTVPIDGPEGGTIIYVYNTVTVDKDNLSNFRTQIDQRHEKPVGKIELGTSVGHVFGIVSGVGELETKTGALPRGSYEDFVSAEGGTIIFAGEDKSYDISNATGNVFNNIKFEGTGERTLGADALIVNGDFTAAGDDNTLVINNVNGATWNLHGDLIYNEGTFKAPNNGHISAINMCGDENQKFRSDKDGKPLLTINILEINNESIYGVDAELPIDIIQHVQFYKGVLNTFDDYKFTIQNESEDEAQTVIGSSENSFINGPLTKYILNKGTWTFPVGSHLNNDNRDFNRIGRFTVYNFQPSGSNTNNGGGYVTVHYYYMPHPEYDNQELYGEGILSVDGTEYWTVAPLSNTSTFGVKIRWDAINNIDASDPNSLANVCITDFTNNKWNKIESSAVGNGSATDGIVTSNDGKIAHTNTPRVYTLAHTDAVIFNWLGTASTDWFDAKNWSGGRVPSSTDFVSVANVATNRYPIIDRINPDHPAEIQYIKISGNASLTVNSKCNLTVLTQVVVSPTAKLILKAPASANAAEHSIDLTGSLIYYGTFTGELTFERLVRKNTYERMCVPVTGYNANNPNLFRFLKSSYERFHYYKESENFDEDDNNYTYGDKF